ncbi:hypothetical protein JZ751_025227 [Albula glossodonta]|uniref:Wbp11/ELF5/Saf1 N-terminal domain-containing protein n=1 Tax=Albula glossodonta TaxID=121402 RepID=A0A8T2NHL9_9TELE|nr:hypothetical protein JZ751_025227 [Albula glossodonta]
MGRRSTSSTKSGKFMNPTDQARKEARKRELKKNKKQRMMVRAAVLKMKDPRQIIRDMEKLDEMVLRDKRKKLRETFERIVRLYERENPDTYKELRKLEMDYETKRGQLSLYFDSVKNAELVEVDSIPLPEMPHAPSSLLIQDIPLPGAQPPSILKKGSTFSKGQYMTASAPTAAALAGVPRLPPGRKPPGPPPGPPPLQVLQLYPSRRAQSYRREAEPILYTLSEMVDAADLQSDSEAALDSMAGGRRAEASGSESEGEGEGDDENESDSEDDSQAEREEGGDEERRTISTMGERPDEGRERERERERERVEDREKLTEKPAGRSVRFTDLGPVGPRERRKKTVKKSKTITPLQAMMLRMAGQSVPEEEEEEEDEEEQLSDHSDGSDAAERPPSDNHGHTAAPPPYTGCTNHSTSILGATSYATNEATWSAFRTSPRAPSRLECHPSSGSQECQVVSGDHYPGYCPLGPHQAAPRVHPQDLPLGYPPVPLPGALHPDCLPQRHQVSIPPPPTRAVPPRPLAPPLSLFPPPLNPNILSAPPSIVHRQKPATNPDGSQSNPSAPSIPPPPSMPMSLRPGVMQLPPPPGTSAPPSAANSSHHHGPTIEKRANITSVSASGAVGGSSTNPATGGATISAKPQIINPKTEVTRFIPTALRVRRERGGATGGGGGGGGVERGAKRGDEGVQAGLGQKQQPLGAPVSSTNPGLAGSALRAGLASQPSMQTKDQVYEAFMREMEGLL